MTELFDNTALNWAILASLLLIIEVVSFTLLFFWLAIAAAILAAISFFIPDISLTAQLLSFSGLSLLAVGFWSIAFKNKQKSLGDSRMNNRAERYIGLTATTMTNRVNGFTKIQIEGITWRAQCEQELDKGDSVKIIGAEGIILIVQPMTKSSNQQS